MMALKAHDKGLEFICAANPEVPALLSGDPGRLRQVLTNLVGNALKFTHAGEIAVRASLVSDSHDEVVIRFSVRDTGIGIPADKQEILFQKFTQADASTTRKYGGTGLGLAIAKQLAEMMGGEIGVISEEGSGSEFWFTCRLGRQTGEQCKEAPFPAEIRGVHVLVVDDNLTNREIVTAHLRSWAVRTEDAPDGPSALKALYAASDAGDPFQAAIIDMQMPGMDGATLGRTIRNEEEFHDMKLILFTSLGQRGDAKKMRDAGFSGYLTKPARQSELMECLAAVLSGSVQPGPGQPIVTRHAVHELKRGMLRILLAEDNITNQQVAIAILGKLGYRVDAVANGAEAIRALETIPYDLVLMDVQMPEMDGLEATRRIRDPLSGVKEHSIPVIAMTAHAMKRDREQCLNAGMNDFLSKPVVPQVLAEMLEKWLPRIPAKVSEHCIEKPDTGRPAPTLITSSQPVFDKESMLARMMGDEDLAKIIIDGFLEDMPRQIASLKEYLATGDAAGAERQVHSMKGASANIGAERFRKIAYEMEIKARGKNLPWVAARMEELEFSFDELKDTILGRRKQSENW